MSHQRRTVSCSSSDSPWKNSCDISLNVSCSTTSIGLPRSFMIWSNSSSVYSSSSSSNSSSSIDTPSNLLDKPSRVLFSWSKSIPPNSSSISSWDIFSKSWGVILNLYSLVPALVMLLPHYLGVIVSASWLEWSLDVSCLCYPLGQLLRPAYVRSW